MSTATRRRPDSSADDKFVITSLRLLGWARENTRALVLALVAVGILAAGVVYYIDYRNRVEEVASTNLQNIRFELSSGNTSQTIESLRNYIGRFGSTSYGNEARILLAHSLLLENRPDEALEVAREASQDMGNDPLATRAGFLMGAAYEQIGDTASAVQVYEQLGRVAELSPEKIRAFETAAILEAARGNSQQAVALYERILSLIPEDSPQRAFYEMKAAEAAARPLTTASAGTG